MTLNASRFVQGIHGMKVGVLILCFVAVASVLSMFLDSAFSAVWDGAPRHSVEPGPQAKSSWVGGRVNTDILPSPREWGPDSRYLPSGSLSLLAGTGENEVHLRFSQAGSLFGVELGVETHGLRSLHWWVPSPELQERWRSDSRLLTMSRPSTAWNHSGAFLRFTW